MDKSESIPICKDCKYFVDKWKCSHPEAKNVFMHPVTGEGSYVHGCGTMRDDYLKCGPKGSFFEYSRWAKLKIAIKEVFNSDK